MIKREAVNLYELEYNTGGLFPSTGGIGTVIFYVVGGTLILCSGILLVVHRKVNFK